METYKKEQAVHPIKEMLGSPGYMANVQLSLDTSRRMLGFGVCALDALGDPLADVAFANVLLEQGDFIRTQDSIWIVDTTGIGPTATATQLDGTYPGTTVYYTVSTWSELQTALEDIRDSALFNAGVITITAPITFGAQITNMNKDIYLRAGTANVTRAGITTPTTTGIEFTGTARLTCIGLDITNTNSDGLATWDIADDSAYIFLIGCTITTDDVLFRTSWQGEMIAHVENCFITNTSTTGAVFTSYAPTLPTGYMGLNLTVIGTVSRGLLVGIWNFRTKAVVNIVRSKLNEDTNGVWRMSNWSFCTLDIYYSIDSFVDRTLLALSDAPTFHYESSGSGAGAHNLNPVNCTASGTNSLSGGVSSLSDGITGFSFGEKVQASGELSVIFGAGVYVPLGHTPGVDASLASGKYAFVSGINNYGAGDQVGVFGANVIVLGDGSFGAGRGNTIPGNNAASFGDGNTVAGDQSIAVGLNNSVPGDRSMCFGQVCIVNSARSIIGGYNCESDALATGSIIFGSDNNNEATALDTLTTGRAAKAVHPLSHVMGGGTLNATQGNCQSIKTIVNQLTTTGANEAFKIDAAGLDDFFILEDGDTITFCIHVTGRQDGVVASGTDGDSAGYMFDGLIKRIGATTSIVGVVGKSVVAEDSPAFWDAAVSADDANDALQVAAHGVNGENTYWTAVIQATKVQV